MKNWKYSFHVASAVLLVHGAVSAQVAPSQTAATQPFTAASHKQSPAVSRGKTPKLVLPSTLVPSHGRMDKSEEAYLCPRKNIT